jgi:hypothetical protein
MSITATPVAHNPNFVLYDNIPWPFVGLTAPGQDEESAPSILPVSETDRLLDLDGLLEILQLVRNIKNEGRLNCTDDEHESRLKEQ